MQKRGRMSETVMGPELLLRDSRLWQERSKVNLGAALQRVWLRDGEEQMEGKRTEL